MDNSCTVRSSAEQIEAPRLLRERAREVCLTCSPRNQAPRTTTAIYEHPIRPAWLDA